MKALSGTLLVVLLSVATSPLWASPGDGAEQPRLEILEADKVSCPERGELCLFPGSPATRLVAWEHGASRAENAGPPRFTRIVSPLRHSPSSYSGEEIPWTLEVTAALRQ